MYPQYYPMMYPPPPLPTDKNEAIKLLKRQIKELKGDKEKDKKKDEIKKSSIKEWMELTFWLVLLSPLVFPIEYLLVTNAAKAIAKIVTP